jgi:hypothetical protein
LYALYAVELCMFLLAGVAVLAAHFSADDLFFLGATTYADMRKIDGVIPVVLASPVIFGFFFRWYFIRGLWMAYAWTNYLAVYVTPKTTDGDWPVLVLAVIHPVVVTAVLVFSSSSRQFFAFKPADVDDGAPASFPGRDNLSAESFLIMRIRKRQPKPAAILEYERGLLQGYWVGAAMMVWSYVLSMRLLGLIGFTFLFACFLFHRRIAGSKGMFFRKGSSSRR